MKIKIKKTLLVTLMFVTLISYANNKINSIDHNAKKTVKVEFNNVKKGQTLIIKNNLGTIVYDYEIKNSGNYSKTFDFSALENGLYSTELNKDFEIIVKQFYIKNGLVTFLNNDKEKVFKPVIRIEKDLVLVSKITFNNEDLDVIIYYKNEIILSETIKGEAILNRVYKLLDNENGDYKIIIKSDDRTYIKDFTI